MSTLLHLKLQTGRRQRGSGQVLVLVLVLDLVLVYSSGVWFWFWLCDSQVIELQRQLPARFLLVPLHQQTEELRLEDALQDAVVLFLMDDDEVVLQSTGRTKRTHRTLRTWTRIVPRLPLFPWFCFLPERNGLDPVELDLPLQNLLDLAFIRAVLHLLSPNQIQELWSQDQVPFHRL